MRINKAVAFLLAAVICLSLTACNGRQSNTQGESDNNSMPSDTELQDIKAEESLSDKLVREIDGALEEELKDPLKYSIVDTANIIEKYTKEWTERADEYYNRLMEFDGILQLNDHYYSSDDFHAFISEMKTNWEQYYQVESENYLKVLEAINTGSPNTVPMMARYEYEMQKEWAVKLIDIYLMVDKL